MSKIVLKNSSVALKVPLTGDLDAGELAINTTDEKMYIKNAAGNIINLTTKGVDLGEFTIANLPDATTNSNAWALATDASGGRTIVYSDGTNWKVVVVEGDTVTTGSIASTLLIHSDTTNGSTTFTDSSTTGHIITAVDNAQHSTAQAKFGSSSMYFDGTGDVLTIGDDTDWDLLAPDFTIDLWIYPLAYGSHIPILGYGPNVTGWELNLNTAGIPRFFANESGGGAGWDLAMTSASTAPTLNAWNHIAVTRSGNDFKLFLNGVVEDTATDSLQIDTAATYIEIAALQDLGRYSNIYMDEIRIINGDAIWTSGFTPPTVAYTS